MASAAVQAAPEPALTTRQSADAMARLAKVSERLTEISETLAALPQRANGVMREYITGQLALLQATDPSVQSLELDIIEEGRARPRVVLYVEHASTHDHAPALQALERSLDAKLEGLRLDPRAFCRIYRAADAANVRSVGVPAP